MAVSGAYTRLPRHREAMKVTVSALPRNLAVQECGDRRRFAVAHRSRVCILTRDQDSASQRLLQPFPCDSEGDMDSRTFITEVKWCRLQSGRSVMVVASFAGFIVLDSNNDDILLHYRLSSSPSSSLEYVRGISCVQNSLCIGGSDGSVLVFNVSGKAVDYCQELRGCHSAVCDLETLSDGRLSSCHEDGSIIIWTNPLKSGDESRVEIQQPTEAVCVCLCSWKELLVGGFSDGKIRVYSTNRGDKLVEVNAHGRWINSLDIVKGLGMLLSVSEDGTASVWKLSTGKIPKVSLCFIAVVENAMLCGGSFWGHQAQGFALTSYDSDRIVEYSRT